MFEAKEEREFLDVKYDFVRGFKPINKSEKVDINLVLDGVSSDVTVTNELLSIVRELKGKGVDGVDVNANVLSFKQSSDVEIFGDVVTVSYKGEEMFTYNTSLSRLNVIKNVNQTFDIVIKGRTVEFYIKKIENGIEYKKLIARTFIAFNETTTKAITRIINTDRYWLYW